MTAEKRKYSRARAFYLRGFRIYREGGFLLQDGPRRERCFLTFSELRRKDIICIGDGRLIGRVNDLVFDAADGKIRALIVSCGGFSSVFHGDKNQITIPFGQVACIGDDVILVSTGVCG